jgi:hypothetical protein
MLSYGPRTSYHLAWRVRGRGRRDLRSSKGSFRTKEGCSSDICGHLHREGGADTNGPGHGDTCRGRARSGSDTRAITSTRISTVGLKGLLRDGTTSTRTSELLGGVVRLRGGTDVGEEADEDLPEENRSSQEHHRRQEGTGQTQEALSEKRKARAWVHKPTLFLF